MNKEGSFFIEEKGELTAAVIKNHSWAVARQREILPPAGSKVITFPLDTPQGTEPFYFWI